MHAPGLYPEHDLVHSADEAEEHAALPAGRGADHASGPGVLRLNRPSTASRRCSAAVSSACCRRCRWSLVGNVCCCLWVVGGGLAGRLPAAAATARRRSHRPMAPWSACSPASSARSFTCCCRFQSISWRHRAERTLVQRLIGIAGTMPSEMRDTVERAMNQREHASIGFLLAGRLFIFISCSALAACSRRSAG